MSKICGSLLFFSFFLFLSCGSSEHSEVPLTNSLGVFKDTTEVTIVELTLSPFEKELRSNGKVYARKKSALKFGVAGRINRVIAKNGDFLGKGDVIAELYNEEQRAKIEETERQLRAAKLEYDDILISISGGTKDQSKINDSQKYAADLRSGYSKAQADLKKVRAEFEQTTLRAPFSGKVANLIKRPYEFVNSDEIFCLIIDPTDFEVEFTVIETEIPNVQIGNRAIISTFAETQSSSAIVTEINPLVDEYGLVKIKAQIQSPNAFWEGMNVKVLLKQTSTSQFSVPKSAVVIRQDHPIIFKYSQGKAIWTYVHILDANSTHYSISGNAERKSKLTAGDSIITSHNMDLVHNSNVKLKKQ